MRRVGFALAIFVVAGMMWGWQAGGVRADTTGCAGTGNYCEGDPACAPDGWCTAQHCCDYPPEPPSGGCTADYQCGSGNCCKNGQCSSECGGGASQCNADYIRNCAGTRTEQITGSQCVRIRTACKDGNTIAVGSAQSVGGCCEEWEVDGELACRSLTVYTHTCCPVGTVASCYLGNPTTSYLYLTLHEELGAPGSSRFNCSPGSVVNIIATDSFRCNRYGERNDEGKYTCTVYRATCRYPGVTLCDCVPACTATAPTGVIVTPGAGNGAVTVSWTPGSGGSKQQLFVDQSQSEVNAGCPTANACEVKATNILNSTTSYPVTGLLPSTTYYFRVVTYKNASCTPSATKTYTTPAVTLSGRVYLDADNNCGVTTPWNLGGLTVSVRGSSYSGSVGSNGRFGFYGGNSNPIAYLDLTGYNSSYIPSTASGCNQGATLTNVANPSSTSYYYLTPYREAWWQAIGGSIYSSGNVRSQLPSASTNLIDPGAGGGYGALMRAGGSVDTGSGGVSTQGYSALTKYRGKLMNYGYFAAHMGVTPNTPNDWVVDTLVKPSNNPERSFYYINPTGIEASITTPWTVANGESYVIFVDGDLRISSEVVVETGGFLALIVKGNLRISPAVTQVQGMYVLNNNLITESNGGSDSKLTFEGSVVAWGGVNLGRDLGASNAASPAEQFVYRTDLLTNMPEEMKVFALRWQEVVPGTIGN